MKHFRTALLIALLASSGVALWAAPASAAPACSRDTGVTDDLDGDGHSDVVVGLPGLGDGAVDVRYTGLPSTLLVAQDVDGAPKGFGSALAIADLDRDGCWDLLVGARGGSGHGGQVHILFGSRTGLDLTTAVTVTPPDVGVDDDFGDSLAVAYRSAVPPGQDGDAFVHDMFVGAPGTMAGGQADAGAVWRFTLTPVGTAGHRKGVTVGSGAQLTQDSSGVPGRAEAGDRFGEELTPDWRGGVVASAPTEDVGTAVDAGAVWQLHGTDPGGWGPAEGWSQNTRGVPGGAEAGDHFGAALSGRGGYVLVGVPDEDFGTARNAGLVQVFVDPGVTDRYVPSGMIHQDTRRVLGEVRAGNRFGASVAAGFGISCFESDEVAIGAPGVDVDGRVDAGAVFLTARRARDEKACPSRVLRPGSGLNGGPQAGARVGGAVNLSLGHADTDVPGDAGIRLLVGVGGEDVDGRTDAGLVLATFAGWKDDDGTVLVDGRRESALTLSSGAAERASYGLVLPSHTFD